MRARVLFSGGKDSSLAALLLDRFYDVTLVHAGFGVGDAADHAAETASELDFPFERLELDEAVADEAVAQMREDGFPRNGIQIVHEAALEAVAETGFDAVADGTRRDDRVPTVDRPSAQSLEDRHDVSYLAPLAGFGRGAIDALADASLVVESGPTEAVPRGDYEAELRALIADKHGDAVVAELFPDHVQSRVTGRR